MRLTLVVNLVMPDIGRLSLLDLHPNLGLLSVAAVAKREGHTVRIYDPKRAVRFKQVAYDASLYEQVAFIILRDRPDAIGFTTLGCSTLFALNVAEHIKRQEPEVPLLFGGPHATMLHRQLLERFPQVDVVVRHEAEETLPGVLRNLERRQFDSIPGISWRQGHASATIRETP